MTETCRLPGRQYNLVTQVGLGSRPGVWESVVCCVGVDCWRPVIDQKIQNGITGLRYGV